MAVEIERRADDLDDAGRQRARIGRLVDAALQDGEFIAAQARDGVALAQTVAHALGDLPEQLVAERVAERVVDALEAIEIETQDRELLISRQVCKPISRCSRKNSAVGQIGQRVMQRHMRDLRLRHPPLGDVLVGGDPAAIRHRLIGD